MCVCVCVCVCVFVCVCVVCVWYVLNVALMLMHLTASGTLHYLDEPCCAHSLQASPVASRCQEHAADQPGHHLGLKHIFKSNVMIKTQTPGACNRLTAV
jgi:hypothetical protein